MAQSGIEEKAKVAPLNLAPAVYANLPGEVRQQADQLDAALNKKPHPILNRQYEIHNLLANVSADEKKTESYTLAKLLFHAVTDLLLENGQLKDVRNALIANMLQCNVNETRAANGGAWSNVKHNTGLRILKTPSGNTVIGGGVTPSLKAGLAVDIAKHIEGLRVERGPEEAKKETEAICSEVDDSVSSMALSLLGDAE